jgi:hypothetical protein
MRFVSVELPTYEEKLKKCKSAVTWCRVCRETACCRTQSNYLPTRQLKKFKSAVTWCGVGRETTFCRGAADYAQANSRSASRP